MWLSAQTAIYVVASLFKEIKSVDRNRDPPSPLKENNDTLALSHHRSSHPREVKTILAACCPDNSIFVGGYSESSSENNACEPNMCIVCKKLNVPVLHTYPAR